MPVKVMANKIRKELLGAKEIAIETLKFLRKFEKKNKFRNFNRTKKILEQARPTAVVLHNCLEIMKKEKSIQSINKLLNQLRGSSKKIAMKGLPLIKKNYVIMTHCHSGEALRVIKLAKKKRISVIATETEPREQGIITVKELRDFKIPVTLIADSAVSYFMKDVDCVILGSDAIRKQGNVNKIGSYNIALAAWQHKKPYYVVADTLKLDKRRKFEIEERPAHEVYRKLKGVKIRNPAFDITPWKFITRVIIEKGIMTPANIKRMLK
jgi:ribose 1,5-bisphosphate isomerase